MSPLATAPILPTTCTVLAGSEPTSSTAPKAPLSARSRARDPRTPSTAPKAPLLARKASRALHIYSYTGIQLPGTSLESRRPLTLFFSFFDHTAHRPQTKFRPLVCKDGTFLFLCIAHHNGEGRGGSGRVGVRCEGLWSHTRALLHHN